jgi:glutathionylspermidine synthase
MTASQPQTIRQSNCGSYGAQGYVRQSLAPVPKTDGRFAVLGSWLAAGLPCGLSVREYADPITNNTSRFIPHAIIA